MQVAPDKKCQAGKTTMLLLCTSASTFECIACVLSSKRIKSDLGNQTLAIPTRQGRSMSRQLYAPITDFNIVSNPITDPITDFDQCWRLAISSSRWARPAPSTHAPQRYVLMRICLK